MTLQTSYSLADDTQIDGGGVTSGTGDVRLHASRRWRCKFGLIESSLAQPWPKSPGARRVDDDINYCGQHWALATTPSCHRYLNVYQYLHQSTNQLRLIDEDPRLQNGVHVHTPDYARSTAAYILSSVSYSRPLYRWYRTVIPWLRQCDPGWYKLKFHWDQFPRNFIADLLATSPTSS